MGYGWSGNAKETLASGIGVIVSPRGNSMTPKIKSGQQITIEPLNNRELEKGDIVFCKVNGNEYVHLVKAIRSNGAEVLIGNNHGKINGWTHITNVYGIVVKIG